MYFMLGVRSRLQKNTTSPLRLEEMGIELLTTHSTYWCCFSSFSWHRHKNSTCRCSPSDCVQQVAVHVWLADMLWQDLRSVLRFWARCSLATLGPVHYQHSQVAQCATVKEGKDKIWKVGHINVLQFHIKTEKSLRDTDETRIYCDEIQKDWVSVLCLSVNPSAIQLSSSHLLHIWSNNVATNEWKTLEEVNLSYFRYSLTCATKYERRNPKCESESTNDSKVN